jgi:hypothetical protein
MVVISIRKKACLLIGMLKSRLQFCKPEEAKSKKAKDRSKVFYCARQGRKKLKPPFDDLLSLFCIRAILRFHGEETMSNSSLLGVMRTSCMKEMEIPQGREAWRPTNRSLATVLPNFHTIRYDLQVRIFIDVFCSFSRQ